MPDIKNDPYPLFRVPMTESPAQSPTSVPSTPIDRPPPQSPVDGPPTGWATIHQIAKQGNFPFNRLYRLIEQGELESTKWQEVTFVPMEQALKLVRERLWKTREVHKKKPIKRKSRKTARMYSVTELDIIREMQKSSCSSEKIARRIRRDRPGTNANGIRKVCKKYGWIENEQKESQPKKRIPLERVPVIVGQTSFWVSRSLAQEIKRLVISSP